MRWTFHQTSKPYKIHRINTYTYTHWLCWKDDLMCSIAVIVQLLIAIQLVIKCLGVWIFCLVFSFWWWNCYVVLFFSNHVYHTYSKWSWQFYHSIYNGYNFNPQSFGVEAYNFSFNQQKNYCCRRHFFFLYTFTFWYPTNWNNSQSQWNENKC